MSPMQKELYRGRTLSCNNCAKPFSADDLTPVEMPAPRAWAPPAAQPAAPLAPATPRKTKPAWAVTAMTAGGAVLFIALLVIVLLPPLNRAREQSNRVKCASNMRQIGQAMFIYASVNGGQFPDKLDKLLSYAGSPVFVCPSCGDTPAPGPTPQIQANNLYAGGHLSYVYVGAGLSTASTSSNAATTPVLYEPLSHHRDGVNVLYADGSVAFLPRGAAQAMIASLAPATQPASQPSTPSANPR
jgi:prepilin-type processing-associated H-X9-DG protein